MDPSPLWSGLAGALVGSLTSIGTLIVQSFFQNRRESQKLIVETAFKDYELRFRSEAERNKPTTALFPLPVMLVYHQKMIALAEKGRLTPESASDIYQAMAEMRDSLGKAHDDYDVKQRRQTHK